jgi:hypothetical protein
MTGESIIVLVVLSALLAFVLIITERKNDD